MLCLDNVTQGRRKMSAMFGHSVTRMQKCTLCLDTLTQGCIKEAMFGNKDVEMYAMFGHNDTRM